MRLWRALKQKPVETPLTFRNPIRFAGALIFFALAVFQYFDRDDPARWWGHKYVWIASFLAGCVAVWGAMQYPSRVKKP